MLSAQPLHAIVQRLCEKVGRRDAAPHGRGTEVQCSAGGGQKNPPTLVPATVHPQAGVPAQPKPWQRFTLMRDLSLPPVQPVRRVKVKCWVLTQRHVLKGGAGRQVTQCSEKTNKAHQLPVCPPKVFDEVCSSEIFGHISFEQNEVKWWLLQRPREEKWVSNRTNHSFFFWFQCPGPQRPPTHPLITLWVPCSCTLHTSADAGGSFQGRVVMESQPSDVCSCEAAGRVGQAAEPAKASPLQMG